MIGASRGTDCLIWIIALEASGGTCWIDPMTVVDNQTGDSDVERLINTIQELSSQLAENRAVALSLQSAAGAVKVHVLRHGVLRRY